MADVGIKISAVDNTKTAFDAVGRGLGSIQTSAASVAGALASIGVGVSVGAFVAMTKQIIDGLDAMNDLRDATGSTIENISALEDVARRTGTSFDTVSTSLIKLNQGLNNAKAGSDTEAAIKAIGLSVKDLKQLDPAEAFRQIAVGLSGFADDANKARVTQELFGKSLKEVAPLLKDVAENGKLNATVTTEQAEAAEKLNKQIFNLQKNALDMGRAFTSSVVPALSDGIDRFILAHKHAGSLLGVLAMYARLDTSKSIQGNLGEVEAKLAALEQRAATMTAAGARHGTGAMIADLKAEAAYLKDLRISKVLAEQGDNSDAVSRRYMTPKASIGGFDTAATKAKEAAAAKALADYNRELAAQAKLMAETGGLTGAFAEDWDRLSAIFKKGGLNMEQLTAAQAKLLDAQPGIKAYNDAEAKAAEAIEKANRAALESRQKYNEFLDQSLGSIQAENQTLQDQIDRLGLNKVAVADLDAARLEAMATTQDLIVLKKIEKGLDEDQYDIYVKTAAELRKQAALKRSGALKETQLDVEKEITAERLRGWQETDNLARDVFASWATDGGNAAQKIGDTLKKALLSAIYEATLKPLVFNMYSSIMGSGASGAAGGVGSSMLGSAAGNYGASALGASIFGSNAAYGAALGTTSVGAGSQAAMLAAQTGEFGAAGLSATAGAAGGTSAMLATAAPYALAALAVYSLFKKDFVSASDSGRARIDYSAAGVGGQAYSTTGDAKQIGVASAATGNLASTYFGLAKSLGIGTIGGAFEVGYNTGAGGANPNTVIGANFGSGAYSSGEVSSADSGAVQLAASRAVFSALQGSELPGYLKGVFNQITASDATQAQINDTLAFATSLKTVREALLETRTPFQILKDNVEQGFADLGTNAASFKTDFVAAIDAGISPENLAKWDRLRTSMGSLADAAAETAAKIEALHNTYVSGYYTSAEQRQMTYGSASTDLAAVGINFTPDQIAQWTRENIRTGVDFLFKDKGNPTGDAQYEAFLKVANKLDPLLPRLDAIATAATSAQTAPIIADTALSAWQDATAAIESAMTDLRSTLLGSGPDSFAKLQAQFAIEAAQAKAGDVAARQDLPNLIKTLADASKNQYTTSVERDLFIARMLQTLSDVTGSASAGGSLSIPHFASGGQHAGGWALVGEQGPELVNMPAARVYNARDTRAMLGGCSDPAVLELLRAVQAELAAIRASSGSTASSAQKTVKIFDAAANGAVPLAVQIV